MRWALTEETKGRDKQERSDRVSPLSSKIVSDAIVGACLTALSFIVVALVVPEMKTLPPSHIGRTAAEIIAERSYFDSLGCLYRAMSWLDLFERSSSWPTLLYSCIEGRYGIEYLLFEELVVGTGANLSRGDYERCVREPTKLAKAINRLLPDYEKLQQFTSVIVSLAPQVLHIIYWKPKELMKAWGELSKYLHWCGHRLETAENAAWKKGALSDVKNVLTPIWNKVTSGQSACMHPDQMRTEIRELWVEFKEGRVDIEGVRIRMNLLRPLLEMKYAQQATAGDARNARA